MTPAPLRAASPSRAESSRGHADPGRPVAVRSPSEILGLQHDAGNRAVAALVRSVQRLGGWSDADKRQGKGQAPGDPKTGWNVEEHAVGTIRRIPLDGLTGGLQGNPGESESAGKLTSEDVAGKVKGPPRSDKDEQKGRGRAIALVPSLLETEDAVQVFFHLHGNTEMESRGFAGWRQHKTSREVRDVARDRIAQQIESANSPQLVGLLPQGVNESNFGQLSVDAYISDAFDRLVEIGAWTKAPPKFTVVLSSHSGGSFTIGRMLRGAKGFQLPASIKTLVLFESLHDRRFAKDPAKRYDQVDQFGTWIEGMLADHLAFLNSAATAPDKKARLDAATRFRLVWDPDGSYNDNYVRMGQHLDKWFDANKTAIGTNEKVLRDLIVFDPRKGVGHEGIVRAGVADALTGAVPAPPKPAAPPPKGSKLVPVQRDLAAKTNDYSPVFLTIGEALAPLIKAKSVTPTRDGDLEMWGSTVHAAKPDVVSAFQAKGFSKASQMADAVYNRNNVLLFTEGWDPQYGGARIGGASREDTLSHQSDRPLTAAERDAAGTVFWGALRMDGVTISESTVIALGGYARTIPDHIYFPNGTFDESGFVPWLIHELTHVWQYQHGAPVGNVIVSAFRGHYDYGGEAGLRKAWADGDNFGDFGFEQQGDILQHYYERVRAGIETSAFDPFVAQVRSGVIDQRLPEVKPITPLPVGTLDVHALNEKFRVRIENEIIAQLKLYPRDDRAVLARRDKVVELFRNFTGYWSGTYRDRIDARAPNDELVTLLYGRMSRATVTRVRDLLVGKAAKKKSP